MFCLACPRNREDWKQTGRDAMAEAALPDGASFWHIGNKIGRYPLCNYFVIGRLRKAVL
jgi:hypothetical protein